MSIVKKFEKDRSLISFEFYPPKTELGWQNLSERGSRFGALEPDFISVTYGAGGSSRGKTIDLSLNLREKVTSSVMPHLTCVGHSQAELSELLNHYESLGIVDILALRGDAPKGDDSFVVHPDGFTYANELVSFIKQNFSFGIAVAGYPEKHPEAGSLEDDLNNLKRKVDAGADFIITQFFFDNDDFYRFVSRCRQAGIGIPIVAGILPATNAGSLLRICDLCGSKLPVELRSLIDRYKDSKEDMERIGIDWAVKQTNDLLTNQVDGVHLYCLNKARVAESIISGISL